MNEGNEGIRSYSGINQRSVQKSTEKSLGRYSEKQKKRKRAITMEEQIIPGWQFWLLCLLATTVGWIVSGAIGMNVGWTVFFGVSMVVLYISNLFRMLL